MSCRPLNIPSGATKSASSGEKSGRSGSVIPFVCVVQPPIKLTELIKCLGKPEEITLPDYSWIGSVLLLAEGRESKGDCQSDYGHY